jgi:hypothetical protein
MPDNDHLFFLERDEPRRMELEEPALARPEVPSPTFTLVLTESAPGIHGLEMVVGQADFQRAMDRGDIVHYVHGTYAFEVVGGPITFGPYALALGTRFSIRQSNTYSTVRPHVPTPELLDEAIAQMGQQRAEQLDQRMGRAMQFEPTLTARIPRRDAATVDGQGLGRVLRVPPPTPELVRRSVWDRLGDDDIE